MFFPILFVEERVGQDMEEAAGRWWWLMLECKERGYLENYNASRSFATRKRVKVVFVPGSCDLVHYR